MHVGTGKGFEFLPADLIIRGLEQGAHGQKLVQILIEPVLQSHVLVFGDSVEFQHCVSIFPKRNHESCRDGQGDADERCHETRQEPPNPAMVRAVEVKRSIWKRDAAKIIEQVSQGRLRLGQMRLGG